MTELSIPPEPIIEKSESLSKSEIEQVNVVVNYLWQKWQDILTRRDIWQLNFQTFISKRYSKEASEWLSKRLAWNSLVQDIIKTLDSDDIEYKFTFSLSPTGMFGLPEGNMLIVPSGRRITSDSIEFGSFEMVKRGTLPEYRKDNEKISIKAESQGLKLEFEDNFVFVEITSKNPEEARDRAASLVYDFTLALTLWCGSYVSFRIISGYDQYGRPAPVIHRLGLLQFTSYNLTDLAKQMQESIYVTRQSDLRLKKSLEYFSHAAFLNKVIIDLEGKSPEQYVYLLSDIILNLYKSVTTVIGDPKKDKDYQSRYKKYGIDYNFWKSKIDRLRDIRNNWDVAHYHISREKLVELDTIIRESFLTTKQTIMKYVEYLDNLCCAS